MSRTLTVTFLLLFLIIDMNTSYAADTLTDNYPGIILVQLKSEKNRIEAMTKAHDYNAIEEVKMDAEEVRKKMILDFTTNCSKAIVYYYMDTNADLVKKKQFDGILMNADGSPVTHPLINSGSEDYVIVYYGYFVSQPRSKDVVTDKKHYVYDWQTPPGRGLVVLNDKYQQIDHYYKMDYDMNLIKRKSKNKKVYYVSKHYDIEYFPFAKLFSEHFGDKYGRRRINAQPSQMK